MIVDTLLVIISPLNPSPLVAATVNWPFSYIRLTDKPSIFGSIENGFYDLFGTDYAIIRYDFSYGFNDVFALGLGRSSFDKIYDIFLKTKLLRQSKGARNIPVSVLLYSDLGIKTGRKSEDAPALKDNFSNRLLYINQLIIGRKFSRNLSLELLPTFIHKNLVFREDEKHQLFSLGFAGRYKITSRFSINGDYFIPIGSREENFKNSFAIGFDYETGGHVFQVMISNAQGPYELTFIENANGDISDSRLYLGFNISRAFSLKGKDSNSWWAKDEAFIKSKLLGWCIITKHTTFKFYLFSIKVF